MLWMIIGICAVLAAVVLAHALLRGPRDVVSRVEHDLEVYRAQLQELERERESGLIGNAEAAAAKLEIERRVLAADRDRPAQAGPGVRRREWLPAALVAGLVPLAAVALYLAIGSPKVPSVPFAARPAPPVAAAGQETQPDVEAMLARVRERLAQDPDDLRGWTILARSSAALGQFEEAIAAYDQAIRLAGDEGELLGGKAEAMILGARGQVTAEARTILREALKRDPENARVRYYLALAKQQDGDVQGAFDDLTAMLHEAPTDAPWLEIVRGRAADLAQVLGLDPGAVAALGPEGGVGPRGPDPNDLEAAESMTPAKQEVMIRGMVGGLAERLAKEPDDLQGWRMLARSYGVLKETEKAAEAYAQVLALAPEDPDALFFLGEAAQNRGDNARAAELWTRLLTVLPPGSDEHALVQERLNGLKTAN